MKLYFESLESNKYFKGPGTYSIYTFRGQCTPYDDYAYPDHDEFYTDIYLKSAEDLDNVIMRIEDRGGHVFSKAILHESKKRINEAFDRDLAIQLFKDVLENNFSQHRTKRAKAMPNGLYSDFKIAFDKAFDEFMAGPTN